MSSGSEIESSRKPEVKLDRAILVDDSDSSEEEHVIPKKGKPRKSRRPVPKFSRWNRRLRQSPGMYFSDIMKPVTGLFHGAGNYILNSLGTIIGVLLVLSILGKAIQRIPIIGSMFGPFTDSASEAAGKTVNNALENQRSIENQRTWGYAAVSIVVCLCLTAIVIYCIRSKEKPQYCENCGDQIAKAVFKTFSAHTSKEKTFLSSPF